MAIFRTNHAAAYLFSRVSGRLGRKVISSCVNDNRPADNTIYGETFVIERVPGIALIAEKGKKISLMVRMRFIGRIIVFSRIGEVIGTIPKLMNMHGIEIG